MKFIKKIRKINAFIEDKGFQNFRNYI